MHRRLAIALFSVILVASVGIAQSGDDQLADYGDAPDGTAPGYRFADPDARETSFPTLEDESERNELDFVRHRNPTSRVFLGREVTVERNGKTVDEDEDDTFFFDDVEAFARFPGLRSLPTCEAADLNVRVTVPEDAPQAEYYLNVLFDWNHDGRWRGAVRCADNSGSAQNGLVPEWAVENLPLHQTPYEIEPGFKGLIRMPDVPTGPDMGEMWVRVTVTTRPIDTETFRPVRDGGHGWDGRGEFPFGETEDYFVCLFDEDADPETGFNALSGGCPEPINPGSSQIDPPPGDDEGMPLRCPADNRPPEANDKIVEVQSGGRVEVTLSATDPDNDELSYEVDNPPIIGELTGEPPNLVYHAPLDFQGVETFDVQVQDGACGMTRITVSVLVNNAPPTAIDQAHEIAEDTTLPLTLGGDDPDGDELSCRLVTPPEHGEVVVNEDCSAEYIPDPDFNGEDAFEFEVDDGQGGTDVGQVDITVTPTNDPPVAQDDAQTVSNEDTDATIDVLANDSDIDGDDLTVVSATDSANGGTVTVNPDGTVTYTPPADFTGTDSFDYTICDPDNECDTATVTLDVVAVNDPPVADDDSATTDEDTPVNVDILDGDTDVDGNVDPSTVQIGTSPSHGQVTVNADGTVDYDPDPDFHGTDTFTYTVCDDGSPTPIECSNEATVTITVNPVNDAPEAATIPNQTVPEDQTLTVDVTCTDVDGDTPSIAAADLPSGASFVDNGDGTGTITYTPDFGVVTHPEAERLFSDVAVTCDDGNGGTDVQAFDIIVTDVNRAPQPGDDSASTDEDAEVTIDVQGNDGDPDSEDAIDTTQITSDPSDGTVAINGDGTVTYTPDADFNGTDTFVYEVCDDVAAPDRACNTATVTVNVSPVNDPPVASDDTDSTDEDTPVTVDVRSNDSDVDGDSLTITSSTQPANGSVDCSGGTECVYTPDADFEGPTDSFTYTIADGNGGFDTATATINLTPVNDPPQAQNVSRSMAVNTPNDPQQLDLTLPVSDVDSDDTVAADSLNCTLSGSGPANGSVSFGNDCTATYTPDQNYVGPDSFDYQVCDDGTNGPQKCDTATVDVTISNDAPTADPDSVSTTEDTTKDLTLTGSDPNGDPLDFVVGSGPSDGTLTCPGDDTDVSSLDCTYTPNNDFNGQDSFTFSVTDVQGESDTATVTIDVTPVNDPPTAQPDSHTTDEDVSFSLTLVGNDPDAGETLSYSITDGPDFGTLNCTGANCTYDPDTNVNSTDTPNADAFTFEVCDDGSPQLCDTAAHTIDITAVDDAPVLTTIPNQTIPEDQTLTVDLSCSDVEGDAITLSVNEVALPADAVFTDNGDGTGSIVYTPPFDEVQHPSTQEAFSGINVTCEANGQSDSDGFRITATDVNRAPTADDETATTDEDSSTTIDVLSGDGDPDSEDISNLFVNGVTSAPSNGSTTINGDGTIQYTPNANFDGPSDSFVYEVCDDAPGELCTTATVTVNVNALNDPPTADDESVTTDEDTAINVDVLSGDNDIDGNLDPSSVRVTSGPSNGSIAVNADGSIEYTPDADFNGPDSFVYEVCDDGTPTPVECTTATVDVTVSALNDAPEVTSIPDQEVFEGNTLSFNVACTDVDGDALSMSASNLPSGVSFVDNGDGTGTFTYSPGFNIVDHPDTGPPAVPVDFTGVTTTCRDTANASDSDAFTLTVEDTDRAPTANGQSLTLLEDGQTSLQLSGSDIDGDALTFAIDTDPANGTLNCPTLPSCTYTPDADYNGPDSFTFVVDDGFGKQTIGTVNLDILPQEDPPQASADNTTAVGSDSTTTSEDTAVDIDVLANDDDPDGDPIEIIGFTQAANGSVSCTAALCTYTPDTDFNGTDTFTYTIQDSNGNTASATVTVEVTPDNDPPSAGNLSFSEPENHTNPQEITFDLPVSDPDLSREGDTLSCTVTSGPANGTLDPSSLGDCSSLVGFTPNAGFVGTDQFTYEVCDSASACASGTVDFDIFNLAPEAIRITTETEEDTELPFALAAEDDNNDPLVYEIITPPSHGTLNCPDLANQPDCTYIPNPDFNGDDSFDYRVTDPHGASDTATANIISVNPINDPPVATDDTQTTDEDQSFTFSLLVSDVDDATADLSCAQITPQPSQGTVSISNDPTSCEATYTPNADANGTDEFAYRVTDPDGLSNDALVTINVAAVNDPPSVTWDDADNAISVDENATMTATVTCTDPDQDAFSLSVANAPSGASFTDNGDGTGTLTYTPGFDVVSHPSSPPTSPETFSDVQINCNDGTSTDSDLLDVTVNDVNRAPDAQNDSYSTPQDTQLSVNANNGVIQTNDSDADGDSLAVSAFDATSAQGGTVSVDADGSFTYDPPSGFSGTDSFSYTVDDGFGGSDTATVTLDVNEQVPDAQDQTLSTPKNTPLGIDITTTDPNGDPVSYTITSGVSNGTLDCSGIPSCTYTPNTDFVGADSFQFEACDDDSPQNCATATVTINVVNRPPDAVDDTATTDEDTDVTIDVRANDSEPDGDSILEPTVTSGPSNGTTTVEADGTITYSPALNFNGSDSFSYEICDDDATNQRCATATVTVDVAPVDDPPTITAIPDQTTTENAEFSLSVACTDVDSPSADLSLTASNLPPENAIFTNLGSGQAELTYTPDFGVVQHPDTQRVFADVTMTCSDTNSSSDEPFDLTVNDTNRSPTANDTTIDMNEDRNAPLELSGGDLDGDSLSFQITSGVSNGTLTCSGLPSDGSCSYTPDANYNGTDSFQFEVSDGFGGFDTGTYTFDIAPVNDAPTAEAQTTSAVDEDATTALTITVNGTDIDGDDLTYSLASGVANGTLDCADIDVDQTCTYLPDADFNGNDSFTFSVDDGNGESDTATVTIPVNPVNDAPTANNVSGDTFQETEVQINLDVDDVDLDWEGETLSCSTGTTAPSNGTASYNDCVLSYTSNDGFVGDETFDYEVCDDGSNGSVLCAEASVTITVNNRQPTAFDLSADLDEDGQVDLTLNGSDPDNDPLTCSLVSGPSNGTATVNPDCTATYEPDTNYNGDDTFDFQVDDGLGGTDTATVSLSVTAVNDEPSIQTIADQTTDEDTQLTVDVTCTDIDTPSANLTVTAANLPSGANFTANGDGTGTVTYTPSFSVVSHPASPPTSPVTFTDPLIRCDDGSLNDSEGFQITVNDTNQAPSTSADAYSVDEDNALNVDAASGVLANDSDADGDSLSVNTSASDSSSSAGGTVTLNADGSFSYAPPADFNGADSFSYTVEDGFGGSVSETVDITVDPVNDAPSFTAGSDQTVDEDAGAQTVSGWATSISAGPSDESGQALSFNVSNDNNALFSAQPSIDASGTLSYTPAPDANGSATVTASLSDDGGTSNGGSDTSGDQTFTITVNPVNDAPTASNDSATTDEDNDVTIDVLSNDTDVDGSLDPASVSVTSAPSNGTTAVNGDGSITYSPNADFNGSDSFSYEACDDGTPTPALCDTATVDVTVNPVNDDPTATAISDPSNVDGESVNLDVSGNFSDVDTGDTLGFSASSLPTGLSIDPTTGVISGTLDTSASQNSPYSVTVTASDGNGGSASEAFTWTVSNPTPTASNDSGTTDEDSPTSGNVLTNDSDPDSDALTVSGTDTSGTTGQVSVNSDGSYTYDPNGQFEDLAQGESATDSFSYTVQDADGAAASATVTITVNGANDAPTSTAISDQTNTEGDSVNLDVSGSFSDPDGSDTLGFSASGLPSGLSIDGATGVISGTIDSGASQNSPFSVTITAEDGNGGSVSETFQWTVNSP